MAITYNHTLRYIQVTGYASGAECTYLDIYNADKAGTLSLHARTGIAAIDGAAVAVTNALQPADYLILGGASSDLYITIANWNTMTNATIRVTGTDRDGVAQSDDIVVNANGNFNTVKWFKTVTHTQVTVFTTPGGGSFDYDLIQGQWGMCWKTGNSQFAFDCMLMIGDGSTATWFADTMKQVLFFVTSYPGWAPYHHWIKSNANFKHGVVLDATYKTGGEGCAVLSEETRTFGLMFHGSANTSIEIYGGLYQVTVTTRIFYGFVDYAPVWCTIVGGPAFFMNCSVDLSYFMSLKAAPTAVLYQMTASTYNYPLIFSPGLGAGVGVIYHPAPAGMTVHNLIARTIDHVAVITPASGDLYMIDADIVETWSFYFSPGATGIIYRQYSFDLRVVDSDGTGIQNATVSMDDRLGANVFSVNTDASGDIATQTITYGYYEQPTGDTIQPDDLGYSPHVITIVKSGYRARTLILTMDRKRREVETLDQYEAVEAVLAFNIAEDVLTGNITEDALIGNITEDALTGDIAEDAITGALAEDALTGEIED